MIKKFIQIHKNTFKVLILLYFKTLYNCVEYAILYNISVYGGYFTLPKYQILPNITIAHPSTHSTLKTPPYPSFHVFLIIYTKFARPSFKHNKINYIKYNTLL
jgi:hypothetical protein